MTEWLCWGIQPLTSFYLIMNINDKWMKRIIPLIIVSFILAGFLSSGHSAPDDMVRVDGGTYLPFYSSNRESTRVEPFYMDKYQVTNRDFLEFVRENPEWRKSQVKPVFADKGYLQHWAGDLDLGPEADQIHNSPVTNISWFAARAYAKWRGKRLPTLDEWEYVASASEYEPVASRDSSHVKRILNWYSQTQPETLPSVDEGTPNFHGVYSIHGLVWEWVQDFNTVFITGESRDGGGVNSQFYCAAGSAVATDKENYAAFIRFAFRGSLEAKYTVKNLGFRCAKDIE